MTAKRNSHHKSRLRQLFATRRRRWIGIGGLIVIIIFVLVSIRHASEEKATEKMNIIFYGLLSNQILI